MLAPPARARIMDYCRLRIGDSQRRNSNRLKRPFWVVLITLYLGKLFKVYIRQNPQEELVVIPELGHGSH